MSSSSPITDAPIEKVRKLTKHSELRSLLADVSAGVTHASGWNPGAALEYLILRAFELEGATVHWPFNVRSPFGGPEVIEQLDGLVLADGIYCLVEAKDRQGPMNFEPIAKMRSQLLRRPAGTVGLLFSKSGFTDAAHQLACFVFPQTILLWGLDEVELCLQRPRIKGRRLDLTLGLRLKLERAVRDGDPKYNLREVTL